MSIVKSDLLKEIAKNCPNFLKKDISKLVDIILYEIQNALKRGERIELRDTFTIEPRILKAGLKRNPQTGQKVFVKDKKTVLFKISKEWTKRINEKE